MKRSTLYLTVLLGLLSACVPAKKYNDLVEKEKLCSEELLQFKNNSIENEGRAKDIQAKYAVLKDEVAALRKDTNNIGDKYRMLQAQYDKIVIQSMAYEKRLDQERKTGSQTTIALQTDLDASNMELQRKQGVLNDLEIELKTKQNLLEEREKRVNELEEMIQRKDEAVKALKEKVGKALLGFENKGLSVVEKNGKVYVSLEAKLLFNSGSTFVEPEGKKALIELAKVLEKETDLEIIVEGHTDTDKLSSASHPKSNWELSVLRATSVVDIMISNSKVNPALLMAAGRSEFHPVDPKDKAKNRRIEVIISPNLNALFELISK
ncbi:MAG: OmpA family protein [Crocinitomicaceae bacterium]|nr:OmpA family protein [Crocinitomicaceae bacterium]